jgi:hypothetical protein
MMVPNAPTSATIAVRPQRGASLKHAVMDMCRSQIQVVTTRHGGIARSTRVALVATDASHQPKRVMIVPNAPTSATIAVHPQRGASLKHAAMDIRRSQIQVVTTRHGGIVRTTRVALVATDAFHQPKRAMIVPNAPTSATIVVHPHRGASLKHAVMDIHRLQTQVVSTRHGGIANITKVALVATDASHLRQHRQRRHPQQGECHSRAMVVVGLMGGAPPTRAIKRLRPVSSIALTTPIALRQM